MSNNFKDENPGDEGWRNVNLGAYKNSGWSPGRGVWTITLWRLFGYPLLKHLPCEVFNGRFNSVKIVLLKMFGAKIGNGVVIRSCEIYYPWNLEIGDNVWIGYEANIYNLVPIRIGNNAVISQRAFLCTGSHDVAKSGFDLIVNGITIKDAAWVSANTFVGPGVTLNEGAVAAAGSVVVKDLPPMTICAGNPCKPIKKRVIENNKF